MSPMLDATAKSPPRWPAIVRGFAGDSTMTRLVMWPDSVTMCVAAHFSGTRAILRAGWRTRRAQLALPPRGLAQLAGADLGFRLRSTGRENVPERGLHRCGEHRSDFDPWPLGVPLFPRRYLRFMAKKEPSGPRWVDDPGRRRASGSIAGNGPAGDRHRGRALPRRPCRRHVPRGDATGEGDAQAPRGRWRSGAARIALEAGVPLVPAGSRDRPARPARPAPRGVRAAERPLTRRARRGGRGQAATDRLREAITALELVAAGSPEGA